MRLIDLLRMSVANLWRRKLRTFLTVLGVIIGTASIVVMVSLGLGLTRSTMEQIEQSGGLTTITVHEGNGMGSVEADKTEGGSIDENALRNAYCIEKEKPEKNVLIHKMIC